MLRISTIAALGGLLLWTLTGTDAAATPRAKPKKDPRADMHVLAAEMSALQTYLLSEADFSDPKNEKAIRSSVASMRRHVGGLDDKRGPFAEDPALRANAAQLHRHLGGVERAFRGGEKTFARYMLQSSLTMCIACHTAGKVSWDFHLPEGAASKAGPLEYANFLFATRQFEKGKEIYEKVIEDYPGNKAERADVQKALNALAVYYVRVKEDTKGGAKYFGAIAKESWLSDAEKKQLAGWADYFKAWAQENRPAPQGEVALLEEAKRVLGQDDLSALGAGPGDEYVRRLRATALLHRVLEAPGPASETKAEALYQLGRIYQRLNHHLFFRFGELYLKACIQEYSGQKVAGKCYRALEDAVKEGYTGSSGTKIPADEKAELDRLKKLAL